MKMAGESKQPQVVSYGRTGTKERSELGVGIEEQLEAVRNRCKDEHKIVFKEFVDAGFSGNSIEKRPALLELLQEIENGKVSELWVWKVDRLTRRLSDLLLIMEQLKRHNVTLRCVSDPNFDPTTFSKMGMQIVGVLAQCRRISSC